MNNSILIVDDTEDDMFFVRRLLTISGIKNDIVEKTGVAVAKQYVQEAFTRDDLARPCAVLCDVKMPGQSGHEFLAWVRASQWGNELPVVMMSQSTLPDDQTRAHALGAADYMPKYPTTETLRKILLSAAGKRIVYY